MSGIFLYLGAVLLNAGSLFFQVFFVVMYSDLEADFINPIDLCNKLNVYIRPEAALQLFTSLLLLINFKWFSFLINLPMILFNVRYIFLDWPQYKLDATEIFRTLNKYKKQSFFKLGFYFFLFFYYLYCMIMAIVESEK
ncbi:ER-derived vesicles protein [Yarrowia sp. B02]|nr:ER-derived vesicles protein [Yarrowia sp. B02]